MTPDEIMKLPAHLQILRLQGGYPARARRIIYFQGPEFKGLFGQYPALNGAANTKDPRS